LSGQIAAEFNLYTSDTDTIPLDVRAMNSNITKLSSNNITFYGTKTFNSIPKINASLEYKNEDPTYVPNISEVKRQINKRACFIDSTYTVDSNPGEDVDPSFAIDSD